ncbi:MAG TPA: DUF1998 domain-containing protein [Caulobacteraceae bacterium]|jgi:hypothetical protein
MAKNVQRRSQLVSTFGPGSMIDLPTRSVIVGGLETWALDFKEPEIVEPRLSLRLAQALKKKGWLAQDKFLKLRPPPEAADLQARFHPRVQTPVFPAWFVADRSEAAGEASSRRRLVRWQDLEPGQRKQVDLEDGQKKCPVTPIRFVCACPRGHIRDIDWRRFVHHGEACREPMWLEERGAGGSLDDTRIVCGCGRVASMNEAEGPGRLGVCRGERPWLREREDPAGCTETLKLMIRTATNTYFPQALTVISLPAEEDELARLVEELGEHLDKVTSIERLAVAREFNPVVEKALEGFDDAAVWARLSRLREGGGNEGGQGPKVVEFDLFASGRAEIGENDPAAKLYAQTLPRETWAAGAQMDVSAVRSLVAVHRLREVACLYGFTRFESGPVTFDGGVDEIDLPVEVAPLASEQSVDWLPAVEQFGEGLFIHFETEAIARWLRSDGLAAQHDRLVAAYGHWAQKFGGKAPDFPGEPYILLHSLSHALMAEIALECGYPASSLKERIYALREEPWSAEFTRCGILVYTATAGAQGSLGGLVATAPRFASILKNALERLRVCSNDPVCADHDPDDKSGDRATHGAACHGCLLIAETSCEMRNLFLDRKLLVPTMAGDDGAFFADPG